MTAVDLDTIRSDINVLRGELVAIGGIRFETPLADLRGAVDALAFPGRSLSEYPAGRETRDPIVVFGDLLDVRARLEQTIIATGASAGSSIAIYDLSRAVTGLAIVLGRAEVGAAA